MQKTFEETMQQATTGDPEAQYHLGIIYSKGEEVLKDLEQAFKWFAKAAKQGHSHARAELENIAQSMQEKLEAISTTQEPSSDIKKKTDTE